MAGAIPDALSLVKFIRNAPALPPRRGNYRPFKKSVAVAVDGLCRAAKSVKVSRDRTVVLTIFWRVCCRQNSANARLGIGADQATAMTRSAVKKDRKKSAA
jgi:hypothetical protein